MAELFCKQCGKRVNKNTVYCPECNLRLTPSNVTTTLRKKKSMAVPIIIAVIVLLIGAAVATLFTLDKNGIIELEKVFPFLDGDKEKIEVTLKEPVNTVDPSETTTPLDSETGEDEEEIPEASPYTVIYNAGFAGQQIMPISGLGYTDRSHTSLELSVLQSADKSSYYIIDYNGNVVCSYAFPEEPYVDNLGHSLGNMSYGFIDKETLEFYPQSGGHGTPTIEYCYIESTGEIVESFIADFTKVEHNIDYAVVRLITPSEGDNGYGYYYNGISYDYQLKYGIVVNSQLVVPCEYEDSRMYQEGICALKKDGKWAYFNSKGEQILGAEYSPGYSTRCDHTGAYCDCIPYPSTYGYIAVCKDGMWAYTDTSGNFITDFEFEGALPVYRGKAWVKQGGEWMVIEFNDYTDYITEEDAKQIALEYLNERNPSKTYTLTALPGEGESVFYLTDGYVFMTDEGWRILVLYNGEIYSL